MTDLTTISDTLDDGSGTFYYHNGTSCMWHIHPENAIEITLNFLNFETEEDFDILKVVNGENNEVLAQYSGLFEQGNLPESITCPSGNMYLIFSTNQTVTLQGWEAWYNAITTGTKGYSSGNNTIKIFPNPVKDEVNIAMRITDKQNLKIIIYSPDGVSKKMIDIPSTSGIINRKINIDGLSKGIYFISVKGETVNFTGKIVKD